MRREDIKRVFVAMLVIGALATAGCGSRLKTIPVMGRVSFGGRQPPSSCFISFIPLSDEASITQGGEPSQATPMRAGGASCATDGTFRAASWSNRDGLLPGRYEVRVSCFVEGKHKDGPPANLVPATFIPPELVVAADARSVQYDVDVPASSVPSAPPKR